MDSLPIPVKVSATDSHMCGLLGSGFELPRILRERARGAAEKKNRFFSDLPQPFLVKKAG